MFILTKKRDKNYRNQAACKMTHQASEMTRFYASEMARRVEMHSQQFGVNNYLTHQQFHEVSTFRNLLSIINLFARMLTSFRRTAPFREAGVGARTTRNGPILF